MKKQWILIAVAIVLVMALLLGVYFITRPPVQEGSKTITVKHKGFRYYPSDQKNFPYGVGIAAFRRNKFLGLYCDKIHTRKDTVLDESNVNILRAALTTYITGEA